MRNVNPAEASPPTFSSSPPSRLRKCLLSRLVLSRLTSNSSYSTLYHTSHTSHLFFTSLTVWLSISNPNQIDTISPTAMQPPILILGPSISSQALAQSPVPPPLYSQLKASYGISAHGSRCKARRIDYRAYRNERRIQTSWSEHYYSPSGYDPGNAQPRRIRRVWQRLFQIHHRATPRIPSLQQRQSSSRIPPPRCRWRGLKRQKALHPTAQHHSY